MVRWGWDEGVPYEKLKKRIAEEINALKKETDLKKVTRLAYMTAFAIQLRNALRIGEAIEAYRKFMQRKYEKRSGRLVTTVTVEKKKREETREAVWPEWVSTTVLSWLRRFNIQITKKKATVYCRRWLGVNTHTLRYARITHLLEKGINPSIIAKITKHSKLDFILKYTQEKIAEKINYEYD